MPDTIKYLDCCAKPALETIKMFLSLEREMVAIHRCQHCGCHWFYWLREYQITTDDYNRRKWYVRLTPEEAEMLAETSGTPDPSLFAGRPGFLRDEDGMNAIEGIPSFLQD